MTIARWMPEHGPNGVTFYARRGGEWQKLIAFGTPHLAAQVAAAIGENWPMIVVRERDGSHVSALSDGFVIQEGDRFEVGPCGH